MYGIINKSIEELVTEKFGEDKWELIKTRSGIDVDYFISNEPYDDKITYLLVNAISEEIDVPVSEVLFSIGEWWILNTTPKKYGSLKRVGGSNLKLFLTNLPQFHNHIMLLYPKLTPPEFKVSEIETNSINVHYFSEREGLKDFVHGLLSGLGKMFETKIEIALLSCRETGNNHEVFKVRW